MLEYIYDAIRATAGEDISITAFIDDGSGEQITEGCKLRLSNDKAVITMVDGLYVPDVLAWSFKIPAEITKGLSGRFWYEVLTPDMSVNFKQPIYLK